ncbi:response regulator receiver domain-containing protein [Halohasta litchfieldiae]|jgi:CheY-like chemotaxis protein|uniref:Response regulator receiver domain-containing protein n=1 Tax=Halohasta litchfieldiae TaxID=1073996 RepID=A0A1H6XPG9_9EURY|nr:response regulator [Halohasta litchfieldiae]ATW86884.1 response regulator receiver domain-containing protein [Halohasta litchfieldiae]SEJ30046.1 Response regulator receiver domain-containing protein [Halohasta litchfieldiae]
MNETSTQERGGPSQTDTLIEAIMTTNRRRLLFHLRQNGSATVDELVEAVERGTEVESTDEVDSLTFPTLYHLDIPKLECLGLLTFNPVDETVELTADPTVLGEWLDLAVGTDLGVQLDPPTDASEAAERRVLIVDDDPDITDLIETYLQSVHDGLSVMTAGSVDEAISVLSDQRFDCIVSDLQMPAASGLDLLKTVRKADSKIPFLLFTGHGSEDVASEAVEHNVTGYVRKTHDSTQFDDLARQIQLAVDSR